MASAKAESASHPSQQSKNSDEEVRLATPPRPGSIAEREHKKWENAPPIENNPYSRENIQKRLWERQYSRRSSENSGIYTELSTSNGTDLLDVLTSRESNMQRFGRDYYVNGSVNEKGKRSSDNPGIHNELSNGTDTDDMSSLRELNIQRNMGDYYDTRAKEKGRRSSDNPGNYELSTSSGSLNDVLSTFRDESIQRSAGDYCVYDQKASVNEKGRRSLDNPGSVEDYYEKNRKSSANKKERRSSDIIIDDVSLFQELNIRSAGDCYTNDSKPSANNKGRRSSGFSTSTSRPSSSLSQRSSFNGIADQDQQEEETQYKETESLLNRSNDVKSKVAKWQNNNVESKYLAGSGQDDSSKGGEKGKERFSSRSMEGQRSWEEQRSMEEILENERKNSKNEVNAKLNNQESTNTVIETKMFNSERNQRKIKRIDLKAYGFENEFCSNRIRTSTPRVVNKLDLRSFGYDDGIRRTQSNIQLNSVDNDEFKVARYANLSQGQKGYKDHDRDQDEIEDRGSGDNSLTQSTETLNKFEDESYNEFKLRPAKSVPNITKCYSSRTSQREDEEEYDRNSFDEFEVIKTGSVRNLANNYNQKSVNIKSSQSSIDDGSENDGDNSLEGTQSHRSLNDAKKKSSSDEEFDNKVLPMPSVRRLAEVFSKQSEHVHVPVTKTTKSCNMYNERSSTPEIQIVETPRQMHSLTARSLSKQFREGLRRIPNKVTSPPASHVVMEQCKVGESQMEVVQPKNDVFNDTNVILPGKLKSNIIFWEQMQKKM